MKSAFPELVGFLYCKAKSVHNIISSSRKYLICKYLVVIQMSS